MYAKGPSFLIGQFQWLDHVYRVESGKLWRELFAK